MAQVASLREQLQRLRISADEAKANLEKATQRELAKARDQVCWCGFFTQTKKHRYVLAPRNSSYVLRGLLAHLKSTESGLEPGPSA